MLQQHVFLTQNFKRLSYKNLIVYAAVRNLLHWTSKVQSNSSDPTILHSFVEFLENEAIISCHLNWKRKINPDNVVDNFRKLQSFLTTKFLFNWFYGDISWQNEGYKKCSSYEADDKDIKSFLSENVCEARHLSINLVNKVDVTSSFYFSIHFVL